METGTNDRARRADPSHAHAAGRRRSFLASASLVTTAIATIAGCNSLLGNDDRILDDTVESMPDRRTERDSAPEQPAEAEGGADGGPGADADAGVFCPAAVCTTPVDCAPNELCIGVSDGVTDGGGVTRFCAAACEAGTGCSSDRQCVSAQSPMTMHCAPKVPVCGHTCNILCGLLCTDLAKDNLNCGACGNTCPAGKTCKGGACS